MEITAVKWSDIKSAVSGVAPTLADTMSRIEAQSSPEEQLCLFKGKFSYGELIVRNGALEVPDDLSTSLGNELTQQFGGMIPLTLVLTNCVEVFINADPGDGHGWRSVPLNLIWSGSMFGVFEAADKLSGTTPKAGWSVSAGARSAVLLTKYNNEKTRALKKSLKRTTDPNAGNFKKDPWPLLAWLAESTDWSVEVLFIPATWWCLATPSGNSEPKLELQRHLLLVAWEQTSLMRIHTEIESHIRKEDLKGFMRRSHEWHIKEILAIASGRAFGFEIALTSRRMAGPFEQMSQFLHEADPSAPYPLIMQPARLASSNTEDRDLQILFYSASVLRINAKLSSQEQGEEHDYGPFSTDIGARAGTYIPEALSALGIDRVKVNVIDRKNVATVLRTVTTALDCKSITEHFESFKQDEFNMTPFFSKCVLIRRKVS